MTEISKIAKYGNHVSGKKQNKWLILWGTPWRIFTFIFKKSLLKKQQTFRSDFNDPANNYFKGDSVQQERNQKE